MNAELTAENNPAYPQEKSAFTVGLRVQRTLGLTKIRDVFKSSSYFFACSRSNTSDSLRYTAKKSARELSVLNGSKNSFRAEWRLYAGFNPYFGSHWMR